MRVDVEGVGGAILVLLFSLSGCAALAPVRTVQRAPDAALRERRVITMAPVDVGPAPTRTAEEVGRAVEAVAAHKANRDGLNLVVSPERRAGTQLWVRPVLVQVKSPAAEDVTPFHWVDAKLRVELRTTDGRPLEVIEIERMVEVPSALDCAVDGWAELECAAWGRPDDAVRLAGRVLGTALADYLHDRVGSGALDG